MYKRQVYNESKVSTSVKLYTKEKRSKLKYWFPQKYSYNKFSLREFVLHFGFIITLSFIFSIVYSNSEEIRNINTWVLNLGGILELAIALVIFRSLYKILRNLKHGFNKLSHGYKLIVIILCILSCFYLYQHSKSVITPLTEFDYESFLPLKPFICSLDVYPSPAYTNVFTTFYIRVNVLYGSISSWEMDINNDGFPEYSGFETLPKYQQHIYNEPGIYIVTLNVKDSKNRDYKFSTRVTVHQLYINIPELEKEIHNLVNTERINYGLPPLEYDEKLAMMMKKMWENISLILLENGERNI